MLGNRRSTTERSEPFPGLNNGGGNINSGFFQIFPKSNCSSRTDIQQKPHEYPFSVPACLQHRRCTPHWRFTVQAGTLRVSTATSRPYSRRKKCSTKPGAADGRAQLSCTGSLLKNPASPVFPESRHSIRVKSLLDIPWQP